MSSKFPFTIKRLNELPKRDKRYYVYDQNQPGLRLYVTVSGIKTFQFQSRSKPLGKTLSRTLGKYPALTISEARKQSADLLSEINSGIDIEETKRTEKRQRVLNPKVEDFADIFIEDYLKANDRRTWKEYSRILKKDVFPKIGKLPMCDVTKQDIKRVLRRFENEKKWYARNRTLAVLSKMFNYALEEDVINFPPTFGIKKIETMDGRDRVLSDEEIKLLWNALEADDKPISMLIKFLIITGQRTGETRQMLFAEIDNDGIWTIPREKTKNKRVHLVPLSSMAVEIIQHMKKIKKNDYVFPGRITDRCLSVNATTNYFSQTIKEFNWERTTVHDLRRTVRTRLSMLGVRKTVAEAILNHKQPKITAIYDRHDYIKEKTEALQKWSDSLNSILKGD